MPVPQHASQPLTLDELERRLPRQRVILIEDRAPSNPRFAETSTHDRQESGD